MAEPLDIVVALVEIFEGLDIPYHLGGSFASSIHGHPRQTQDADLVVELKRWQIPALVKSLEDDFYVDAEAMQQALRSTSSFNLIHLETGFKIDLFPKGQTAFDRLEFARHRVEELSTTPARKVYVKTPEDTVLRKLDWYRIGGFVSDRQWGDILGVLMVQGEHIDRDYLRRWAAELDLSDLLEEALRQATKDDDAG